MPADGLLTFAIDVPEADLYVTGSVLPAPRQKTSDRACGRMCSAIRTLIAAPMIVARALGPGAGAGGDSPTSKADRFPAPRVPLTEWLLTAGRHYITVAGPHFRPAGQFSRVAPRASPRALSRSRCMTFALLSDTHVSTGRRPWMNVIMYEPFVTDAAAASCESTAGRGGR
jgi:hypothetical protein